MASKLGSVGYPPKSWRHRLGSPHTHDEYDPEFKASLCGSSGRREGRSLQIARDLGIGAGTLGNWVPKTESSRATAEGLSSDDRAELVPLRRRCASWNGA